MVEKSNLSNKITEELKLHNINANVREFCYHFVVDTEKVQYYIIYMLKKIIDWPVGNSIIYTKEDDRDKIYALDFALIDDTDDKNTNERIVTKITEIITTEIDIEKELKIDNETKMKDLKENVFRLLSSILLGGFRSYHIDSLIHTQYIIDENTKALENMIDLFQHFA